ncbi:MAG TPA: hypothetical protein VF944_04570, partial [Candidatus Bathyarchaeia archaeon]
MKTMPKNVHLFNEGIAHLGSSLLRGFRESLADSAGVRGVYSELAGQLSRSKSSLSANSWRPYRAFSIPSR